MFEDITVPRMNQVIPLNHSTISAILITCDDAAVVEDCLISLKNWVDEIVAVDMYSTDGTREILARYTDKIIDHERLSYADPIRNYSLSLVTCDWVILIDPDERVPELLAHELVLISQTDQCDVVVIPFQQIMFGTVTRSRGASDGAHPRFFRRGSLQWPPEVHGSPDLSHLRVLTLPARGPEYAILHNTWRTVPQVVDKLMRYTPKDVINLHNRGVRFSTAGLLHTAFEEFFVRFFRGKAYQDGMAGLLTTLYFTFYKMTIMAMMWESEGHSDTFDKKIQRWGKRWSFLGRTIGYIHRRIYKKKIHSNW